MKDNQNLKVPCFELMGTFGVSAVFDKELKNFLKLDLFLKKNNLDTSVKIKVKTGEHGTKLYGGTTIFVDKKDYFEALDIGCKYLLEQEKLEGNNDRLFYVSVLAVLPMDYKILINEEEYSALKNYLNKFDNFETKTTEDEIL